MLRDRHLATAALLACSFFSCAVDPPRYRVSVKDASVEEPAMPDRHILVAGDSLSADPYEHPPHKGWVALLRSRLVNADIVSVAFGGSGFGSSTNEWKAATLAAHPETTDLVVFWGVNDCRNGATLLQMQNWSGSLYDWAAANGWRVYALTQAPNITAPAERTLWNAWILATPPGSVTQTVDVAGAVTAVTGLDNTWPLELQSDDDIHPNEAGQMLFADVIRDGLEAQGITFRDDLGMTRYYGDRTATLLANTNLYATAGGIVGVWTPARPYTPLSGRREVLFDFAGNDGQLIYYSDGTTAESALVLMRGGIARAYAFPRHVANVPIVVRVEWGAGRFATIEIDGRANTDLSQALGAFAPNMVIGVGRLTAGSADPYGPTDALEGTIQNVGVFSRREVRKHQVGCLGDSISRDDNASATAMYGHYLARARRGWIVQIAGATGDTLVDLLARAQADVVDQAVQRCIVVAGIEDIVTDGVDAATLQTRATAVYDLLAAGGVAVYPSTIFPFGNAVSWNAGREAVRAAFNSWLLATPPASVTGVLDGDVTLRDPAAQTDLLAAYDSGDGLHPNAAGHEAFSTYIQTILKGGSA